MKTALILLSILGMACAFSMKNLHRRAKVEASEENGVFKSRPHYFLYKHAYVYPLKRFLVQGGSDSSEENEDGDSSEQEEEEETSNEEENNEESAGNEEEEAENVTLSAVTPSYGTEATTGDGAMELAALQLPKRAGDAEGKAAKMKESDEEEEEEEGEGEEGEEEGNGNEEAEVDENEQLANGTSANSTEADGGNRGSGGGVTPTAGSEWTTEAAAATARPTPAPEALEPTAAPTGKSTAAEYWGEYEQTGNNELTTGEYEVYDQEQGEPPRGDNYRAYEDEYSYYKGRGYDGYDGQEYYYHQ